MLSGLSADKVVGSILWELFPDAIGSEFETAARCAVREQRQINLEYYFPTFGRWYENRFYPTPDGLLFFTSDIHERKRMDERLREEEARHRAFFEVIHDGILIVDDSGRYLDVNPSFCRILKGTREQLIGAHFSQFIPHGRLEEAARAFANLKAGKPTPLEFPLLALDGTTVDLEWSPSAQRQGFSYCVCRDISERRKNAAAMQESEERHRRAVEAGKVGLWEWDIPRNRVIWSDYIYELHGLEHGSFGGTVEALADVINAGDRSHVREALAKALAGQGDFEAEYRAARSDGQLRWLTASGKVAFTSDGQPKAMHGAVIDTTTRRIARDTQAQLEEQLTLLIEASARLLTSPEPDKVLTTIVDLAGRFIAADGYSVWRKRQDDVWQVAASSGLSEEYIAASTVAGFDADRLPSGPLLFENTAEDTRLSGRAGALLREGIQSMLAIPLDVHGSRSASVVFYWRTPHKSTATEIRIASSLGNLAASALGTADLYERQMQLRNAAEAAEERAAFLAEAGAVLSSSLDFETTLAMVAELAVPSFADSAEVDLVDEQGQLRRVAAAHSVPGKFALSRELAVRYPPREDDPRLAVLKTGQPILIDRFSDEHFANLPWDTEHLQMVQAFRLRSIIVVPIAASDRNLGLITFATAESNRTYTALHLQTAEELGRRAAAALENARLYRESQQAQEELRVKNTALRRANEDLNQFAYSASHDLKEPLRMVAIYSQLLGEKYQNTLDADGEMFLGYTLEGAQRMEALLRDMLAYTEASNNVQRQVLAADAQEALAKALANLRTAVEETGAVIRHDALPRVRVPEIQLVQLFQNLVGNALKYRRGVPEVIIRTEREGDMWRFAVSDNGIGFNPRYKDLVFGLFKRLHSPAQYAGTGVGLAICQKIVEQYGGTIRAEAEEGRGATFFFTLPVNER